MPKIPNFLRPSVEVARERMRNTIKLANGSTIEINSDEHIHALPGNPVYPELFNRLQAEVNAQLHIPSVLFTPGPGARQTAAYLGIMEGRAAADHVYYMTQTYGCFSTGMCMPHRPEPPLRKTVHSTVLEQKQLT